MYRISVPNAKIKHEVLELARMFMSSEEFSIASDDDPPAAGGVEASRAEAGAPGSAASGAGTGEPDPAAGKVGDGKREGAPKSGAEAFDLRFPQEMTDRDERRRMLYDALSEYTGASPEWGVLTGVRPLKVYYAALEEAGSPEGAAEILRERFYVSDEKIGLLADIRENQKTSLPAPESDTVGLYIGIPFCPSRCLYCSFTSNLLPKGGADDYLDALFEEIKAAGDRLGELGKRPESVYIGGGTPTSLSAGQLSRLMFEISESFDMSGLKEYTVEAGRPDTISDDKLAVMRASGADRISINPQSMKEDTLDIIGRLHSPQDIERAFEAAQRAGFSVINADLIAGLPRETVEDFIFSLKAVIALKPSNITVHTLAVKRASTLIEIDADFHRKRGDAAGEMLSEGRKILDKNGFQPYYIYRQKNMAGNLENVGYALPGSESLYNMRIMEEKQSIAALGAGGISKLYFSDTDRLERIPNVSNYEIYIEKIGEIADRKRRELV